MWRRILRPMEAYAHYNGLDMKKDFLQILEGTARQCGVIIIPEESRRSKRISELKSELRKSFCEQQLEGSGLTLEDVVANVVENGQEMLVPPFQPGQWPDSFPTSKAPIC